MAIGWLGRAIWLTEGTEDGGRNLELELKFKLEQEHGPGPEQSMSTPKSRSKRQSQCSARAQSSRFWRQKPREGMEVRSEGKEVYKEERSGSG
jgi:hypothetical protein